MENNTNKTTKELAQILEEHIQKTNIQIDKEIEMAKLREKYAQIS